MPDLTLGAGVTVVIPDPAVTITLEPPATPGLLVVPVTGPAGAEGISDLNDDTLAPLIAAEGSQTRAAVETVANEHLLPLITLSVLYQNARSL